MKHFILEGCYLVPFETFPEEKIKEHRNFLQKGYVKGFFLLSGPQTSKMGGFLVARAETLEELQQILLDEPFTKAKMMHFETIKEFNPIQFQPFLKEWFE
ncbi:MAG: YciI family protein [Niabella sp.]